MRKKHFCEREVHHGECSHFDGIFSLDEKEEEREERRNDFKDKYVKRVR